MNVQWQPLHISRSCANPTAAAAAPPAAAAAPATSSSSSSSEQSITQHAEADTATVGDGSSSSILRPRGQLYSRLSGVGGLNLLVFELAMLLVLAGSLPAVYLRKRRYIRL